MEDEEVTTKKALAKKLGVSRSSLYYKLKKPPSDEELRKQMVAVMEEHPSYGHRRIAIHLKMNKKRVIRVMKRFGLRPKIMRKRPFKPNDCKQIPVPIPNLIKGRRPVRANEIWVGDFTHLVFLGQFLYIATVMDLFTREIVGWHVARHHTTDLIVKAFEDAVRRRQNTPLIFRSDQGSEYVSGTYGELLRSKNVQASFSKKSSPWENGHRESWNGGFKLELGEPDRFAQAEQLIEAIHLQVHYYNTRRIHTSLKMSPQQFYVLKTTSPMTTAA